MRAALELIAEKGPAGFTFADAARWAGVSPAAPYRHYRDRDALLADVARRGFEAFADALTRAWDDGAPDVLTAFDRLGRAYLQFAKVEAAYLFGHVRGRSFARQRSGFARRPASAHSPCCAARRRNWSRLRRRKSGRRR